MELVGHHIVIIVHPLSSRLSAQVIVRVIVIALLVVIHPGLGLEYLEMTLPLSLHWLSIRPLIILGNRFGLNVFHEVLASSGHLLKGRSVILNDVVWPRCARPDLLIHLRVIAIVSEVRGISSPE